MTFAYLAGLLIGIAGMATIDWRYKLAFWRNKKQTWAIVLTAMAVFLVWDFLGIWLGIFIGGTSQYQLPFSLAPHFPLEELFFLFLLSYCTLVIYSGVHTWRSHI